MQTNVATLSDRDMRAKGKELKCAACHMPDFSGKKEAPRLAGLDPNYIGPQIAAFTAGKRPHPPVDGMSGLSEEDAESLAQYLAQLE